MTFKKLLVITGQGSKITQPVARAGLNDNYSRETNAKMKASCGSADVGAD
jgi:hypothetical protein